MNKLTYIAYRISDDMGCDVHVVTKDTADDLILNPKTGFSIQAIDGDTPAYQVADILGSIEAHVTSAALRCASPLPTYADYIRIRDGLHTYVAGCIGGLTPVKPPVVLPQQGTLEVTNGMVTGDL